MRTLIFNLNNFKRHQCNDTTTLTQHLSYEIFQDFIKDFNKTVKDNLLGDKQEEADKTNTKRIVNGSCYVYLMIDTTNNFYKIGISNHPKYREHTLQSDKPSIELLCAKKYPSRVIVEAIESALHKSYAKKRIRGEWFNLDVSDIEDIKQTLKQLYKVHREALCSYDFQIKSTEESGLLVRFG